MNKSIDIQYFKNKLESELAILKKELESVGQKNPDNPADWEPMPARMDILKSDKNEVADNIEEYEERSGILKELETQYNEVLAALQRIEKGTYGKCESGGEQIPTERLEAFPAARTCLEHAEAKAE
jgi:RNA polymerase-binding transcription factor DksA